MATLKIKQLRRLILKEVHRTLLEVGEKNKKEEGEDSLDAQIDNYFVNYETESRSSKTEGNDFRMLVRRFLLEVEEEEEETDEDVKETEKKDTKKLTIEDIDVNNFVDNVIRLVDNYDALLSIRNIILRRASNFLIKGYEQDVSQAFKDSLLDRHGLEIGKSEVDVQDKEYQVPIADRAGVSLGA